MEHFRNGAGFRGVFPRVSEAWTMLDVVRGSRLNTLAQFLVGHCHTGAIFVLWDPDEWVVYPWCEHDFTHNHFTWSCRGMSQERLALLKGVGPDRGGDVH